MNAQTSTDKMHLEYEGLRGCVEVYQVEAENVALFEFAFSSILIGAFFLSVFVTIQLQKIEDLLRRFKGKGDDLEEIKDERYATGLYIPITSL